MVWQQENKLNFEDFLGRYRLVVLFFSLLFLGLSLRLFYLQVVRGNYYREQSEEQRTHIIPERAPRGIIYDYKGNVIVGNKTAFVALFYPFAQKKAPPREVIDRLQGILNKDLAPQVDKGWRQGQMVKLANDLTRTEMFRIQEQRMMLPGISVVREARREYAAPEANSHLIGYLNEITARELETLGSEGYRQGERIGRGGLEQTYNGLLRGQDGGWQIEVDALGHQTRIVRRLPPLIGNSLHTTIDEHLQVVAAEALNASPTGRGAVVGIDPRTGAIRVMVSTPGFDPQLASTKEFAPYLTDKQLPLYNRTVQALYAPGSTFKIITFIAGLVDAGIDPSLTFFCPGKFQLGNKTFRCWYKKGHGNMSLIPALTQSCNVYFYQLGLKTGSRSLEKFARQFHLGEKTGIPIPSEKRGLIPSAEWKLRKMHIRWQRGDTVNMAIGQGAVWVTPVQMACLIATVANSGAYYQPYLVDSIVDSSGKTIFKNTPHKKDDVMLPPRVWDLLHIGLESVVTNGTGRGCYIPEVKVAGKTGTAQNPQGNDHAWFVSYAPADKPELALAVIVENGGHGGTAAVPITRKIYEANFNLVKEPKPEQVDEEAAAATEASHIKAAVPAVTAPTAVPVTVH